MAKTVTNTTIDGLASAVPAPYGPLTRVSNWETDFPEPNSEIKGLFTSSIGDTEVWLSHAELTNAAMSLEILERAHDWTAKVTSMKTAITAIYTLVNAMSAPHTYADYQSIIDEFRTSLPEVWGSIGGS